MLTRNININTKGLHVPMLRSRHISAAIELSSVTDNAGIRMHHSLELVRYDFRQLVNNSGSSTH